MKKNTKLLLTLTLVGTTLFSCSSSVTPINGAKFENQQTETVETFNIVNATSDYAYLDGLPEKGEVGKTYTFRVSLKPGYHFNDKVTITCGENNVDVTFENGYYSFIMPNGDIAVSIDVGATDFTITNTSMFIEKVMLDDDSDDEVNVKSATAGTALKFEPVYNDDYHFTKITMNNVELEEGEDGFYHFIMPSRPVVLSSDKNETYYNLNLKNELTLSSLKMYTDETTKLETNKAYKNQKVYMDFTYLSESTKKIIYSFDIKSDSEENPIALDVKQVENTNVYYFEMISSDINISITEKDCTKFLDHKLVNKSWKLYYSSEPWGSSPKSETKEYASMTRDISFIEEGTGVYNGTKNFTWDYESNNYVTATYTSNQYSENIYFTDHIILKSYYDYNAARQDSLYVGTYSNDYAIHSYIVKGDYMVFWIEDENRNILESLTLINNSFASLYNNLTFKKEDNTNALGSDIENGSIVNVYNGDVYLGQINNSSFLKVSDIELNPDENTEVIVKDKDGNIITSAIANETIYVYPSLKEGIDENTILKSVKVTCNSKAVTVTKVDGQDNVYSFTMPNGKAIVNVLSTNPTKYQNYPVLGTYITYNMCYSYSIGSDRSGDMDYSSSSLSKTTFNILANGDIEKVSYKSEEINITSLENTEQGKMTITDGIENGEIYYSNGLIVTPYSVGKTSYMDVHIGIRVPEDKDPTKVKTHVHFNHDDKFWAISFFVEDELFGSLFCYNEQEVYTGVEFTFDEGSTRINSTSSYHVVKDGVTLFDVSNDVVTAHQI